MKYIYNQHYMITDLNGKAFKSRAEAKKAHQNGARLRVWLKGSKGQWVEGGEI